LQIKIGLAAKSNLIKLRPFENRRLYFYFLSSESGYDFSLSGKTGLVAPLN
jgi:hypothetical protein